MCNLGRTLPEQCDATRSTCVSRDTKPSVPDHPWPDCRVRCTWRLVTILRKIERLLSCSPSVPIARSARPLLAELCRGVVSTTTPSGIFAFTFSATAMIEGSLSQRSPNFPTTQVFHEVCHWACKVLCGYPFCPRCYRSHATSTRVDNARHVPRWSSALPSSARAFLNVKFIAMRGLSSRSNWVSRT